MNIETRFLLSIITLIALKITVINSQTILQINGNVLIHEINNNRFENPLSNSKFIDMIMGLSTSVNMTTVTKTNKTITRNKMNITEIILTIIGDVEIFEVPDDESEDNDESSSSSSSSSESHEHKTHYTATIRTTTIPTIWYCKTIASDLLNCSRSNGSSIINVNNETVIPDNSYFNCYFTNISNLNCSVEPISNVTITTRTSVNTVGTTTSINNTSSTYSGLTASSSSSTIGMNNSGSSTISASLNYTTSSTFITNPPPVQHIELNCSLIYNSVLSCSPSPVTIVTTQAPPSTTVITTIINNITSIIPQNFSSQFTTSKALTTSPSQNINTTIMVPSLTTSHSTSTTHSTTTSCPIYDDVSQLYGSAERGSISYTFMISNVKELIMFSGNMFYSMVSISTTNNVNVYGDVRNLTGKLKVATIIPLSTSVITAVRIYSTDVIHGLQFELYDTQTNSLSWQKLVGVRSGKYSVLDVNSISSLVEMFEITSITFYVDPSMSLVSVPFISGIKFEYSYSKCQIISIPTIPTTTFFITTTLGPITTRKTSSTTTCPVHNGNSNQFGHNTTIGKLFSVPTNVLQQIIFFADDSYVYAVQFIFFNHSTAFYGDEADLYYEQEFVQIINLGIGVQITAINIKSDRYVNSIQVQTYDSQTNKYLWSPVLGNKTATLISLDATSMSNSNPTGIFSTIQGSVDCSFQDFNFPLLHSLTFGYSYNKC